MATPEALIAWAYRFGATSYVLRVDVDSAGAEDLTFNAAGSALSTSTDYYMGGEGQANDILYFLKYCIELHTGGIEVDVYLNANHRVQIDVVTGATDFQIHWAHANTTLDPEIFGFGHEDTGDVATVTSDERPLGIWAPGLPVTLDDKPRDQIVGGVATSMSGKVRVSNFGTAEKDRFLSWTVLPKAVVRGEYAARPSEAFQHAWTTSMALGRPFRLYVDDDTLAVTHKKTYRVSNLGDPMSRSGPFNLRWDVNIQCKEDSSADYSASVYSFDSTGTECLVDSRNIITGSDTEFTVAFWHKYVTQGSQYSLMGQWATNQQIWYIFRDATDRIRFAIADSVSGSATNFMLTTAISSGWVHVLCTYNAGTAKIFINGKDSGATENGTIPSSLTAGVSTTGIACEGDTGTPGAKGYLDDCAIWDRALNANEIAIVYDGLPTDVPTNLQAWWAFERDWKCSISGTRPTQTNSPNFSTDVRS